MEATFCKKLAFAVVVMALALTVGSGVAWAQNPITADSPYQVTYFVNAHQALDGKVRIVSDGATGTGVGGNICANFYVVSNEELSECCACNLTPDEGRELSISKDLTSNPVTGPPLLKKGVIKMLATKPASGACDPTLAGTPTLASGLNAWITHVEAVLPNLSFPVTEEEFRSATLSAGELAFLKTECSSVVTIGGGKGICTCGTTF
jgi:hypothetical protein